MFGRGGGTNNHSGNIKFRKLCLDNKFKYIAASKVDKPKVAREVVAIWRKQDPPGRFLTKASRDKSKGQETLWRDVGDQKAREKASQCLRERTPEVKPFLQQLQKQGYGHVPQSRVSFYCFFSVYVCILCFQWGTWDLGLKWRNQFGLLDRKLFNNGIAWIR